MNFWNKGKYETGKLTGLLHEIHTSILQWASIE